MKIRHLWPKQCRFDALESFILTQGTTQNNVILVSLIEKEEEEERKKKPGNARGEALPQRVVALEL